MKQRETTVAVVFAMVLFGLLLFLMREFLNPLLVVPLLFYLFYRNRKQEWARSMFVVTAILFLIWFASAAKVVLAPFVIGFVLGYLFNPIVDRLERLGVRRTLGVVTVGVPLILVITLVFILLIPKLVTQLEQLFEQIPVFYVTLQKYTSVILEKLQERGIVIERRELFDEALRKVPELLKNVLSGTINLVKGISAVITFITYLVVIPIVSFYWMRDSSKIYRRLLALLPKKYRRISSEFSRDMALIFERYIRGQLVMSAIVGVLTTLLFWAFRVEYSILLGIIAGVLNIIPRVGFILSIIPALLIGAFTHDPPLAGVGKVIGVFLIVVVIETITSPRILGRSVRLHPLVVLLAVFLGTFFFGVMGLLLAVPAVAIMRLFFVRAERRYRRLSLFRSTPDEAEESQ